jgi:hypothetical protein
MTQGRRYALAPLLSAIGENIPKLFPEDEYPDTAGISPGIYLTLAQWRRILEEFGTQ